MNFDFDKYPYFVYPMLHALEGTTDEKVRKELQLKIAANVGDEEALRSLFDKDFERFMDFYPDMHDDSHTTDDTIDSFIEKFGGGTVSADTPLLPEDTAPSDYFAAIGETNPPEDTPQEAPSGNLSFEFAKILLKNGNYSKALEIINGIYLNNPEKSVYFADQIRFIKKLMILDERKKNK